MAENQRPISIQNSCKFFVQCINRRGFLLISFFLTDAEHFAKTRRPTELAATLERKREFAEKCARLLIAREVITQKSERCAPRSLQVHVAAAAVRVDDLAERQRPSITEALRIATELVTRRCLARGETSSGTSWPSSTRRLAVCVTPRRRGPGAPHLSARLAPRAAAGAAP